MGTESMKITCTKTTLLQRFSGIMERSKSKRRPNILTPTIYLSRIESRTGSWSLRTPHEANADRKLLKTIAGIAI